MSDSTPIERPQIVTLRSPINGEPWTFQLIPGVPPTLDTLINVLKFERIDPEPEPDRKRKGGKSHGTSETDGHT